MADSPAARVLSRAVDVRSGEVPGLLAAFAYHFLLFTAYYILRPIRDSMGVAGGVENLDDLFGWTLLGMLAAVPLFGWISGRFRRAVFLPWTYLFFVAQLVAFWAVFTASEHYAATARVFFVWVSVFNLFVIAVFWSFMADLFDKEQGKRLFAFITAGASVGTIAGSAITTLLARAVGDVNLLLVSAALLASTLALMRYLLGWSARREDRGQRPDERPYAITLKDQFIGVVGFTFHAGQLPELGYWLGEPYWGRGIMSEAVKGLIEAAFGTRLFPRIRARALASNPGSLNTRLAELRELGVVDHAEGGYRLTEHGRSLMDALAPLQGWADEWARRQSAD